MKSNVLPIVVSAVALLIFAYLALYFMPVFFPGIAEQYFASTFREGSNFAVFYYLQAILVAIALYWVWNRFYDDLKGSKWLRGLELGFLYAFVAVLPAMLINYSILSVSASLVFLWLFYGICQGALAGLIFAFFDRD
ncbi:MAG: hypothetical protein Q4G27_03150 [Flavobacteriaceae bacterium]|nr:hypothetical protein [Flavobacteriaceae bacterium]